MANVKITELTAATALAGTDVLPIVDVGADATKKVSVSDLLRNLPDGTASAPALAFADDQNTGVLSPGNNSLAFATSGTQRLVIDSSGRVGIGETNVQSTLHVAKNIADSDAISWANSQLSVATPIAGNSTANRATIYFAPYGSDNNYAPSAISASAGTSGASTLKFFTNASGNLTGQVQSYERMRIDSSGRLLIGTTTEGHADADNLTIRDSGNCGLTIRSGSSNAGSIYFSDATSGAAEYDGYIAYNQNSRYLRFGTAQTERMRINSSGNVGIGTTSADANLHIKGGFLPFTLSEIVP